MFQHGQTLLSETYGQYVPTIGHASAWRRRAFQGQQSQIENSNSRYVLETTTVFLVLILRPPNISGSHQDWCNRVSCRILSYHPILVGKINRDPPVWYNQPHLPPTRGSSLNRKLSEENLSDVADRHCRETSLLTAHIRHMNIARSPGLLCVHSEESDTTKALYHIRVPGAHNSRYIHKSASERET